MDEAVTYTKQLKDERATQDNFVAEAGLDSWEEALTTLPQFVTTRPHLYTGANKHKELAFKVAIKLVYVDCRTKDELNVERIKRQEVEAQRQRDHDVVTINDVIHNDLIITT